MAKAGLREKYQNSKINLKGNGNKTIATRRKQAVAMENGDVYITDKCVRDTENEVTATIQCWDRLLMETKMFSSYRGKSETGCTGDATSCSEFARQTLAETGDEEMKFNKLPESNEQRSKINNNSKAKTTIGKQSSGKVNNNRVNAFAKNVFNSSKVNSKFKTSKAELKMVDDKLTETAAKLSAEKNHKMSLSNLTTLDQYEKLEFERQTRDELVGKVEKTNEALEHSFLTSDKCDLQQWLEKLENVLANIINDKRDSPVEEYERNVAFVLSEKLKEIQEERRQWNDQKIKLEIQLDNIQNTLDSQEEKIEETQFIIDSLNQDKQNLMAKLNQGQIDEFVNHENQIEKLSTIIVDLKNKFAKTEELHYKEMSEMKNQLNDKNKLIEEKTEFINQQKYVLDLMREVKSDTNDVVYI